MRITIVGLGLLGGSMALALKKSAPAGSTILGFSRREETLEKAKERGAVDAVARDLASAVKEADLVMIATPVLTSLKIIREMSSSVREGCLVTDMGSTKLDVVKCAGESLPPGVDFIGGHPMAGKETSGIDEADEDLFRGCVYCLCPLVGVRPASVEILENKVRSVGARPLVMEPEKHDHLVASVSHLPMLLSAALVSTTMGNPGWPDMARLAAGGYRDVSRLASGNPEMNRDIFLTNRSETIFWLDILIEKLQEYRRLVAGGADELTRALSWARQAREGWMRGEER
ncbi:MAG: prephenate dehydrogenase [Dehalococcoidia bacterium]|nr:prephenate dehydrogenase [Dehalococcoidia bacterium]